MSNETERPGVCPQSGQAVDIERCGVTHRVTPEQARIIAGLSYRKQGAALNYIKDPTASRAAATRLSPADLLTLRGNLPERDSRRRVSSASWQRGDEERYVVDEALGSGAYDSPYTSEADIDDALAEIR